jgi:hypothetical protein
MNGNDSSVETIRRARTERSSRHHWSEGLGDGGSDPLGGPERHRQATRSPPISSTTPKSNVIGTSGKPTFIEEPIPFGPSV